MLYLDFAPDRSNYLWTPMSRFDLWYEQSWFDNQVVIDIACKADNLKHVWADFFTSDLLGRCSGKDLSGSAKTLIIVYLNLQENYLIPLQFIGENCIPILGRLDIKHDVTFAADTWPFLMDFGCKFISKQSGKIIDNFIDYREEWITYAPETKYEKSNL